ncbi:hypothetical protein ACJMK2_036203 [Sinanodonta woodiana]|uniref:Uncharacterized protein n=1 Tax=Sinanodonta woodiana TaxID=1069815 RepID=A0ABD3WI84_SINWO
MNYVSDDITKQLENLISAVELDSDEYNIIVIHDIPLINSKFDKITFYFSLSHNKKNVMLYFWHNVLITSI